MDIDEILTRGVEEIIVKEELEKKLKSGKKLRIKFGIDPTSPDLHLGHTVLLRKLKQFQDLGHQIVLIIGDYTATIGDPSARKEARKILSLEEVAENAKTYLDQVGKILDIDKTEIHKNSEWYDTKDTFFLFELSSKVSVQHVMKRDDFQKRLKQEQDISMLETIYPLLQGYDSVCVNADLELGGTDQKFNLLMGRKIQRAYNQPEQDIMTLWLLEGLDGVNKMSKSMGNYIGISEEPKNMYGKVMSIPDSLIVKYFRLLTNVENKDVDTISNEIKNGENPRNFKAQLAKNIVELYHGQAKAEEAEAEFVNVFSNRELPTDIQEVKISADKMNIVDIIVEAKLAPSKSEARRLVEQGGVSIDSEKIIDANTVIDIKNEMILKVGKLKFAKITK